jgi:pimeloyl-ACP methyl ester carboxylesterase
MSTAVLSKTTIAGFPCNIAEVRGARPPLLYLHGAFVTHESFNDLQAEMARLGWGGVSFSRRGRLGVGPVNAAGLNAENYIEDTVKVIEALPEAPFLVGHSLGGLVAQKIMEMGLCRAAILLAPAPAGMLTAQPVALPSYLPMLPSILAGRSFLPPKGTCARIVLNAMPQKYHGSIHGALVHESGKVYRQMMSGAVKVDEHKVRCPVLVMAADQDRIISVALARATAEKYGADFKLYLNHAHLFFAEPGWQAVAADMAEWLGRMSRNAVPFENAA